MSTYTKSFYPNADDTILIEELKAGEILAFNALYNRYITLVIVMAHKRLEDKQMAEEAANDLMNLIWLERLDIEIKSTVKGYLFMRVRTYCKEMRKSLMFYKKSVSPVDEESDSRHSYSPNLIELKEIRHKILKGIEQISAHRNIKVFRMQFIDAKPQKEIAEETQLTIDAVKNRIRRARKEVRDYLKKNQ